MCSVRLKDIPLKRFFQAPETCVLIYIFKLFVNAASSQKIMYPDFDLNERILRTIKIQNIEFLQLYSLNFCVLRQFIDHAVCLQSV